MTDYDLITIGTGVAGTAASWACAEEGWRVAIVDNLPYGGTCPLRGCDPKKILRRGAEIIDYARLMEGKGIAPGTLSIDWPSLMAHKRGFTEPMSHSIEQGLKDSGIETLHGRASFTGPDQITIGGTTLSASHFLIATGARPKPLPFPGSDLMITSTDFMELEQLPKRIVFVGGGFISFEFAHIAARAGAQTTILTHGSGFLKKFDPDLVELLLSRSRDIGIATRNNTSIREIRAAGAGYQVVTEHEGETQTMEADLVVHGAGREPDLADLNLDVAGINHTAAGVTVTEHLRSVSNPAVYAAGDAAATGGMPLTPVASMEGAVAASNMMNGDLETPDYTGIPTTVFTIPELVRVGLLESEAREQGKTFDVSYSDTSSWFSNYRTGETTAAVKILVDRDTDLVIGAHMLGPEYSELVNVLALAMKLGLTTQQLKTATAAYPSVGTDLSSML